MDDFKILVAVVTGLFGLFGAFIGAWLSRRTDYEKWLRQERSVAFSEFIRQAKEVSQKAINVIYDSNFINPLQKDIKITELFVGLDAQENIVRLYLKPMDRKAFSKIKHELWIAYSPEVQQSESLKKVDILFKQLQSLFEKTIDGPHII